MAKKKSKKKKKTSSKKTTRRGRPRTSQTTKKSVRKPATRSAAASVALKSAPKNADLLHVVEPLRPHCIELAALKIDPRNARLHSTDQLNELAKIMSKFGWDQPLIYNPGTGMIVKGEARFLAATTKLKWKYGPALAIDEPAVRAVARGIADNRVSDLAGTDQRLLAILIDTIKDDDPDLMGAIGFTTNQIDGLLASIHDAGKADEDDPGKLPNKPTTKPGDIYILGDHKLLCGDATNPKDVEKLFVDDRADMIFTDAPYGIAYVSHGKREALKADNLSGAELVDQLLGPAFKLLSLHATEHAAYYIWHSHNTSDEFREALVRAGLTIFTVIVWCKPNGANLTMHYRGCHEPCFYAGTQEPHFYGNANESTVWRISLQSASAEAAVIGSGLLISDENSGRVLHIRAKRPKNDKILRVLKIGDKRPVLLSDDPTDGDVWEINREHTLNRPHPTMKPVELARRAILNSSKPGEIVADTFAGSGSTLVAAETVNRRCFAMEISPGFCDLIVKRWETMTRKRAERIRAPRPRSKGTKK